MLYKNNCITSWLFLVACTHCHNHSLCLLVEATVHFTAISQVNNHPDSAFPCRSLHSERYCTVNADRISVWCSNLLLPNKESDVSFWNFHYRAFPPLPVLLYNSVRKSCRPVPSATDLLRFAVSWRMGPRCCWSHSRDTGLGVPPTPPFLLNQNALLFFQYRGTLFCPPLP